MKQTINDEIRSKLMKNKNLTMILYILSQIPSYTHELAAELRLPKSTVREAIRYLREKRLIRVLDINSTRNTSIGDLYPLLLKKMKKIRSRLSPDKVKSEMKKVKFYFISHRGVIFLPFIQEILFKIKKGDKK